MIIKPALYEHYKTFLTNYLNSSPSFIQANLVKRKLEPIFRACGYRNYKDHHNILIIHYSKIGDFVIMTCGIRYLYEKYPDANITLLCTKQVKSLTVNMEGQINIVYCDVINDIFSNAFRNIVFELSKEAYDDCYLFLPSAVSILLAYLSGANHIHANCLVIPSQVLAFRNYINYPSVHKVFYIVDEFFCVFNEIAEYNYSYWILSNKNLSRDEKLISICCGGSVGWKRLNVSLIIQFIICTYNSHHFHYQLLGNGTIDYNDSLIVINEVNKINKNIVIDSYVNKLSLYESCEQLAKSKLSLSSDSSLAHLSAAAGTPVLVVYACAKLNATLWKPYGVKVNTVSSTSCSTCDVCTSLDEALLEACNDRVAIEQLIDAFNKLYGLKLVKHNLVVTTVANGVRHFKPCNSSSINNNKSNSYNSTINNSSSLKSNNRITSKIIPLFSVIIYVSNNELNYLEDCLSSIVSQNFKSLEFIIVNNNKSSSACYVIIRKILLSNGYSYNVRVINNDINFGLSVAKGDYLIFVNHTDLFTEMAFKELEYRINCYPNIQVIHFQKYFSWVSSNFIEVKESVLESKPRLMNMADIVDKLKLVQHSFNNVFNNIISRQLVTSKSIKLVDDVFYDNYFTVSSLLYADSILIEPFIIFYKQRLRLTYYNNCSFLKHWIFFIKALDCIETVFDNLKVTVTSEQRYCFYSSLRLQLLNLLNKHGKIELNSFSVNYLTATFDKMIPELLHKEQLIKTLSLMSLF